MFEREKAGPDCYLCFGQEVSIGVCGGCGVSIFSGQDEVFGEESGEYFARETFQHVWRLIFSLLRVGYVSSVPFYCNECDVSVRPTYFYQVKRTKPFLFGPRETTFQRSQPNSKHVH